MTRPANRRRSKSKPARSADISKPRVQLLTTPQLVQLARRRRSTVEAYIVLNGGLRATHWLTYLGEGNYLTEGIDGEEYETTADDFTKAYAWVGEGAMWHVDDA